MCRSLYAAFFVFVLLASGCSVGGGGDQATPTVVPSPSPAASPLATPTVTPRASSATTPGRSLTPSLSGASRATPASTRTTSRATASSSRQALTTAERNLSWQRDTLAAGYERFLQSIDPADKASLAKAALDLQGFEAAARQQIKTYENQPAPGTSSEVQRRVLTSAQTMLEAIRQLECYVFSAAQREDCRQAAEDAYDQYQGHWQDAYDLLLRQFQAQGLPTPTPQPSYVQRLAPVLENLRTASALVSLVLGAQKGGGISTQEVCRLREFETTFRQVPTTLGQLVPPPDLRTAHGKLLVWADRYGKVMAQVIQYCSSRTPAQANLDKAREELIKGEAARDEAENLLDGVADLPPRIN